MKRLTRFLVCVGVAASLAAQEPAIQTLPASAKRWAVVIGVDEYDDANIGALKGASADARSLRDALVSFAGFPQEQVIVLATGEPKDRRPTRVNILKRLVNLEATVPHDGLLLVAFSGHGIERDHKAFLLGEDSQMSEDAGFLEDTAINLSRIRDRIDAIGVSQVVLLIDACRNDPAGGRSMSGNTMSSVYTNALKFDLQKHRIRAFATLYATAIGDRAYEYAEKQQGYFTWAVVEGLRGAAASVSGEVTLSGLVRYVQDTVPRLVARDLGGVEQLPLAQIEGFRAEDLVLAVTNPKGVASPTAPATASATADGVEVKYWESVERLHTIEAYDAYRKRYPSGSYADLALMNRNALLHEQDQARESAEKAYLAGDFVKARQLFEAEAAAGDAEAQARLGALHLLCLGGPCSTAEATRLLESALQKGSQEAEAWLAFGWTNRGIAREHGFEYTKASAARGNYVGQIALGDAYAWGVGVEPDPEKADAIYAQALPELRRRLERGDLYARLVLAAWHKDGRGGVTKDVSRSLELNKKASDLGSPSAQLRLAWMYGEGTAGMTKDPVKAVQLCRNAAEQGSALAETDLGIWYEEGRFGLPRDATKAVSWYAKAAEQGFPRAQANLATMYADGSGGLTRDLKKAKSLLDAAAEQGDPYALRHLGLMYLGGNGVTRDNAKAVEYLTRAVARDDSYSKYQLGFMYEHGEGGLATDLAKAATLYQKAADDGLALGQAALGYFYQKGLGGLTKDAKKAVALYQLAADQNEAAGQFSLGYAYQSGEGVARDDKKAAVLYQAAAAQGNAAAQNNLGALYMEGRGGLPKDPAKAVQEYKLAADQDDAVALSNLAGCYLEGTGGLTKNRDKAIELYERAAARGNTGAKEQLAKLKTP